MTVKIQDSYFENDEITTPATPDTGKRRFYAKTDGFYEVDDAGVETKLGGATDELSKVSANDTTAGYLSGKLAAGTNIQLTETSDGGNEGLTISATVASIVSSFEEVTRNGANRITDYITWTDSGKTTKIEETSVTRNGFGIITQIVIGTYNAGALETTLTGTITRTAAGKVDNINWVAT